MKTLVLLRDCADDPLDAETAWVELPEGYRQVFTGRLVPGDRYINWALLRDGITQWEPVSEENLKPPVERNGYYDDYCKTADYYYCLIRKGEGQPEKPCQRCGWRVAEPTEKYCDICGDLVIEKLVEQGVIDHA